MAAFKFKQFELEHDKCAMKIGTDGVLLGAWAHHPSPKRILDIGCGSGLISFMMAQRFENSEIIGIDSAASAILQSEINLQTNPWKNRIQFQLSDISDFKNAPFDLIVSNPPFYNGTSFSGNSERDKARQNNHLSTEMLFDNAARLLNQKGIFCCIIPIEFQTKHIQCANSNHLYLNDELIVKGHANKAAKRILLSFSKEKMTVNSDILIIESDKRHQYSKQYLSLVKDFYLFA